MMLKLNCLEPLTAMACALIPLDGGATALTLGGVTLFTKLRENARKAGLENAALMTRMQKAVLRDMDHWQATQAMRDAVVEADAAMTARLPEVMLTREQLAASSVQSSGEPYPRYAAGLIVNALAEREPIFAAPADTDAPLSLARDFALQVLIAALTEAMADRDYATQLQLDLLIAGNAAHAKTHEQNAETHTLLSMLLNEVRGLAHEKGVRDEALIGLARRIVDRVDSGEEALAQLERAISAFVEQRELASRGTNLGSLVDDTLRRIAENNEQDAFDEGARLAQKAYAELTEQESAMKAAKLTIAKANIEQHRLRFDANAMAYWICERILLEQGAVTTASLITESGEQLRRAMSMGLPLELSISIQLAERAVAIAESDLGRATALMTLGQSQSDWGRRLGGEAGLASIIASIEAFQAGLALCSPPSRIWAGLQSSLGLSLRVQGEWTGGQDGIRHLIRAVEACEASQTVFTKDSEPAIWAKIQINIGTVYRTIGERVGDPHGTEMLKQAVSAIRSGLLLEETDDHGEAITLDCLGIALANLGMRSNGEEGHSLLKQAVEAFEGALAKEDDTTGPASRAQTKANLANTLRALAQASVGGEGVQYLQRAVEISNSAIAFLADRIPVSCAFALGNLALCYEALAEAGEVTNAKSELQLAKAALDRALSIVTAAHMPHLHERMAADLARISEKLTPLGN